MTVRIALNFEDGVTRFIDCRAGETVLDAAYRNKINLPMDCSDGVCGTCKCRCEQGRYDLGDDYLEDALSAAEASQGLVLTCQMIPSSDCVVAVPTSSGACKTKPVEHTGQVALVERVSESTTILNLNLDRPEALSFLPGQYVNLHVPGAGRHRAYSFSSKPGMPQASFLIRNVAGGLMSRWLETEARSGDQVCFVGPNGSFFLRPPTRRILMLAGGTGLAPLLSMLEVLADDGCREPIRLLYGVTKDADVAETDRLAFLAGRLLDFRWSMTVADPSSAHELKGYVTEHLSEADLHAGDVDLYLCGPPAMVESVRAFLKACSVEPARFYYEKFAPGEAA